MNGIYVCIFKIEACRLKVGALGEIAFKSGLYLYVGSAQRSLKKRIERHKNQDKKALHWHIDYVSSFFPARECYALLNADKSFESQLASMLGMLYPCIEGFGAGDSKERSHFFRVDNEVMNVLENFAKLRGAEWTKV